MRVRVLGSSGSEVPGHNSPAFLIDDFLLLDAGTVSLSLDTHAQCKISHILLTHAHLDHIKAIPFLLDNIVSSEQSCQITVLSGKDVLGDLKRSIFNDRIWPDFTMLPTPQMPVLKYEPISTRGFFEIRGFRVYASRVNHAVPAYGYMVENASRHSLLYTGDTGPTAAIWKRMRGHVVKGVIVEVSFPNEMQDLAIASGHLTPSLLKQEIQKMPSVPDDIYITHLKPYYRETIEQQLRTIDGASITLLEDGLTITI